MTNLEQSIKNTLPDLMEFGINSEEVHLLGLDEPYSLKSVLSKLIDASNILLHEKNYDGHGWELLSEANKKASDYIARIENYQSIGKPITLPDVLRWMQTLEKAHLIEIDLSLGELFIYNKWKNSCVWDLTIPNLTDQNQEVKDFLEKLRTDQK